MGEIDFKQEYLRVCIELSRIDKFDPFREYPCIVGEDNKQLKQCNNIHIDELYPLYHLAILRGNTSAYVSRLSKGLEIDKLSSFPTVENSGLTLEELKEYADEFNKDNTWYDAHRKQTFNKEQVLAYFENCRIDTLDLSRPEYAKDLIGYIKFSNCHIKKIILSDKTYGIANAIFINCTIEHVDTMDVTNTSYRLIVDNPWEIYSAIRFIDCKINCDLNFSLSAPLDDVKSGEIMISTFGFLMNSEWDYDGVADEFVQVDKPMIEGTDITGSVNITFKEDKTNNKIKSIVTSKQNNKLIGRCIKVTTSSLTESTKSESKSSDKPKITNITVEFKDADVDINVYNLLNTRRVTKENIVTINIPSETNSINKNYIISDYQNLSRDDGYQLMDNSKCELRINKGEGIKLIYNEFGKLSVDGLSAVLKLLSLNKDKEYEINKNAIKSINNTLKTINDKDFYYARLLVEDNYTTLLVDMVKATLNLVYNASLDDVLYCSYIAPYFIESLARNRLTNFLKEVKGKTDIDYRDYMFKIDSAVMDSQAEWEEAKRRLRIMSVSDECIAFVHEDLFSELEDYGVDLIEYLESRNMPELSIRKDIEAGIIHSDEPCDFEIHLMYTGEIASDDEKEKGKTISVYNVVGVINNTLLSNEQKEWFSTWFENVLNQD